LIVSVPYWHTPDSICGAQTMRHTLLLLILLISRPVLGCDPDSWNFSPFSWTGWFRLT
jgi:hypothetical protein